MKLPAWVEDPDLTPAERQCAIIEFLIRRAACYHSRQGSIMDFSHACGFGRNHLYLCMKRGVISRKTAFAIESVVGDREVFAASMFE